ncbi:MAG: hypothetical protein J3R72DRAFT_131041 [Linnemannia gamsii]|nr:MAG: hypothetical protein J3R72DRAFT_131041 [Linnemannia gamsii]
MGNALCCQRDPKESSSLSHPEVINNITAIHNGHSPSSAKEKGNTSSKQVSSSQFPSSSSSLHPNPHQPQYPQPHSYSSSSYDNNNNQQPQLTSQHHYLLHPSPSTSSSSSHNHNKRDRRPTNGSSTQIVSATLSVPNETLSSANNTYRHSNSNSNRSKSSFGTIQFTPGPGTLTADQLKNNNSQSLDRAMERNTISPDYQWLDGRRYHNNADANYLLPNDIDEVDSG